MDHDLKCESGQMLTDMYNRWAEGVRIRDPQVMAMLRDVATSGQLCACMARRWGIVVPLDVGLRIAQKKVDRYVKSWMESGDEAQARRIKSLADKIDGSNVISLEDHRASPTSD